MHVDILKAKSSLLMHNDIPYYQVKIKSVWCFSLKNIGLL